MAKKPSAKQPDAHSTANTDEAVAALHSVPDVSDIPRLVVACAGELPDETASTAWRRLTAWQGLRVPPTHDVAQVSYYKPWFSREPVVRGDWRRPAWVSALKGRVVDEKGNVWEMRGDWLGNKSSGEGLVAVPAGAPVDIKCRTNKQVGFKGGTVRVRVWSVANGTD